MRNRTGEKICYERGKGTADLARSEGWKKGVAALTGGEKGGMGKKLGKRTCGNRKLKACRQVKKHSGQLDEWAGLKQDS